MKDNIFIACSHCGQEHKYRVNQLMVYYNKQFTTTCKNCKKRFPITVNSRLLNSRSNSPIAENPHFKTKVIGTNTQIAIKSPKPQSITRATKTAFIIVMENEYCQRQKLSLKPGVNIVGRGPKSHGNANLISINGKDQRMSRSHCKITVEGDSNKGFKVCISDASSTNATYINENKLRQIDEVYLTETDSVRIGRTTFKIYFQ